MDIIKNNIKKVTFGIVNDSSIEIMVLNALINQKPLFWCNGTLISFEPYGLTDWSSQEAAAGNIYFLSLTKAPMKEFTEKLKHHSSLEVPVVNMSNNRFWQEVLENV